MGLGLIAARLVAGDVAGRIEACGVADEQGLSCRTAYDLTGSVAVARNVDRFALLVNIAAVLVGAYLLTLVVRLVIRVVVRRAGRPRVRGLLGRVPGAAGLADALSPEQAQGVRVQRAETLGVVVRSLFDVFIWATAVVIIFTMLGVPIGPLLAGAGIVGVALGFGAQNLVRDYVSGVFIVAEGQFRIGDVIDTGFCVGTVESVTLRATVVRDGDGVVWHIPNGRMHRVANRSAGWSQVQLVVTIDERADTHAALAAVTEAIEGFEVEPDVVFGRPTLHSVADQDDATAFDLRIQATRVRQWEAARTLRTAVVDHLAARGIRVIGTQVAPAEPDQPGPMGEADELPGMV
jgi:small-conductance mechanosensitive channel